ATEIEQSIEHAVRSTMEPVVLIGHSRGGLLARAVAARMQARCGHLIALGSPVGTMAQVARSGWTYDPARIAGAMGRLARASNTARRLLDRNCNFPECQCEYLKNLGQELSDKTAVLSIYSRDDAVVPPQASMITGGRNVE